MKKILSTAYLALGFAGMALAQVPIAPGSVVLEKPQITTGVKTPTFNVNGGPQKRSTPGDWLEVEVAFEVKPDVVVDELTFKYTLLVEKKLVVGEVTHVNIPKGKDRYSVMYISPRAIERLTGGKPLNAGSVENAWVEVTRQGQTIFRNSAKAGAVPNLPQVPGILLNKTETPFAPLFWDRYEAVKGAR